MADEGTGKLTDILPLLFFLAHSGFLITLATSPVRSLVSNRRRVQLMVLILGNYGLIVALLGVYALYVAHFHNNFFFFTKPADDHGNIRLTNYLLLISIAFLVLGFTAINRFGGSGRWWNSAFLTQLTSY